MKVEPLRQVVAVLVVFAVLAASLWLLWRRGVLRGSPAGARGGPKPVERLGRVALSPHHAVELLRIGPRVLVVGLHTSGCSLLAALPAAELEEQVGR